MRGHIVWVLAFALAACDSDGPELPVPSPGTVHSGSRLKLAWYETSDGFRTWAPPTDLLDAKLDMRCAPVRWTDGVVRCTPDATTQVLFLDAECTKPVLAIDKTIGIDWVPSCAGAVVDPKVRVPTGSVYFGSRKMIQAENVYQRNAVLGECVRKGAWPVQTIASTVPASALMTLYTSYQGSGALATVTLQADDGLVVPLGVADRTRGLQCDISMFAGDVASGPCIPAESAVADAFTDSTCMEAAVRIDARCETPQLAYIAPPVVPGSPPECAPYYEVEESISEGVGFEDDGRTCRASTAEASLEVHPLGAAVELPRLTRAAEPSNGRAQLIYIGDDDARVRQPGVLFDSALMRECSFDIYEDGREVQCLPTIDARVLSNVYADSDCTQRLTIVEVAPGGGCLERTGPSFVEGPGGYYHLGPVHVGDVYFPPPVFDGSDCVKSDITAYDLGEKIDQSLLKVVKKRDP